MANLRLPGPTPVPPDVVDAMSKPMIDHRGVIFKEMLLRMTSNLQVAFNTKNDLYVLTSSGTGALEAAVTNTLSKGEKVLAVSIGNFGDRFSRIAKAYGADVVDLKFPEGESAPPDSVRQALETDPSITTVLVTHNETSTGITNDIEGFAEVVKKEFNKLLLVDAISSLGSQSSYPASQVIRSQGCICNSSSNVPCDTISTVNGTLAFCILLLRSLIFLTYLSY